MKELVVADGISGRHQIKDDTKREALRVARVLAMSLDNAKPDYPLIFQGREPMAQLALDVGPRCRVAEAIP